MNELQLDALIDFQTAVRMGNPIGSEQLKRISKSSELIQRYVAENDTLKRSVVAAIFEFASVEPSNNYKSYDNEEFQDIFDAWQMVVDEVRDALNT